LPLDIDIFGKGIYSPRQAARLVGGTPQEIRRWTRGSGPTEPLWNAYYQGVDDAAELSFADLIEVRVVRAFKQSGVSTQAIRFAIAFAQDKYGVERPLSTLRFKTDGSEILMDAIEKDGDFVSLAKAHPGQKISAEIVKQSVKDLEYEGNHVARWRPSAAREVVIDPNRQFGSPVLDDYGIATSTLFEEFQIFSDARYLAKIYELPLKLVNEAIRFETQLEEMNG